MNNISMGDFAPALNQIVELLENGKTFSVQLGHRTNRSVKTYIRDGENNILYHTVAEPRRPVTKTVSINDEGETEEKFFTTETGIALESNQVEARTEMMDVASVESETLTSEDFDIDYPLTDCFDFESLVEVEVIEAKEFEVLVKTNVYVTVTVIAVDEDAASDKAYEFVSDHMSADCSGRDNDVTEDDVEIGDSEIVQVSEQ